MHASRIGSTYYQSVITVMTTERYLRLEVLCVPCNSSATMMDMCREPMHIKSQNSMNPSSLTEPNTHKPHSAFIASPILLVPSSISSGGGRE